MINKEKGYHATFTEKAIENVSMPVQIGSELDQCSSSTMQAIDDCGLRDGPQCPVLQNINMWYQQI